MMFYNANLSTSVKSRLAQMAIYPVHGMVPSMDYTRDEEFAKHRSGRFWMMPSTLAKIQRKDFKMVVCSYMPEGKEEREPNDEERLDQAHAWIDGKASTRFGLLLRRYFGQQFTAKDCAGVECRWTFAKRAARNSEMTITRVAAAS